MEVMSLPDSKPRFSESIEGFCRMIDDARSDYSWNFDEVHRLDQLTQDYLHSLELDHLSYRDRAKVATRLAHCRQQRRDCKDTVLALEPLIQFLDSDKGKNMMNLMRETLGKTRKVEQYLQTRTYVPRVLEQAR